MALTPLASASDLATLTGLAEDDPILALGLRRASSAIRAYTQQTITAVSNDVQTLIGGRIQLTLPERPVTAVTTVKDVSWPGISFTINSEFWRWDGSDQIRIVGFWTPPVLESPVATGCWPDLLEVTYSHGWSAVPDDLEDVCLELAVRKIANPEAMRSERIGSYSYTVATAAGEFTDLEQKVLNRYRRRTRG